MLLKKTPKYILTVTLEITYPEDFDIAASRVVHPKDGKPSLAFDDQELADYNDMIDTVVSILDYNEFDVVDEHQTTNTYSYYIDFFPTDFEGNRWNDSIRIKFRFANHPNRGADATDKLKKQRDRSAKPVKKSTGQKREKTYIKSFWLGSKQYPDQRYIVGEIDAICDHLKLGDYSDFVKKS